MPERPCECGVFLRANILCHKKVAFGVWLCYYNN